MPKNRSKILRVIRRRSVRQKPRFKAVLAVVVQRSGHLDQEILFLNKRMAFGHSEGGVKYNAVNILRSVVNFVSKANKCRQGVIADAWCLIRAPRYVSYAYPAAYRLNPRSRFPDAISNRGFSALFRLEEDQGEVKQAIRTAERKKICRRSNNNGSNGNGGKNRNGHDGTKKTEHGIVPIESSASWRFAGKLCD